MASTRAFKNLASLRSSFSNFSNVDDPLEDEPAVEQHPSRPTPIPAAVARLPSDLPHLAPALVRPYEPTAQPVSPITGKVDRRRLRKVLKTPSVSLSVAVRSELHEEVSAMLFARKTTWIALLDTMLDEYVSKAKETGHYPK